VDSLLSRITITPGLRSGQPCIRDLRITVWDILKWLGTGASHAQILSDYPELTEEDILAALQWAAALKDNHRRQGFHHDGEHTRAPAKSHNLGEL
jgi:uncharacterized protein (DUF433 family)